MSPKILMKLLNEFEHQFVGILLENNVCNYIKKPKSKTSKKISNRFNNIYIKEEFLQKYDVSPLSETDVTALIGIYPSTHRSSKKLVADKFLRFLQEHPAYTPQYVINIVKAYLDDQMYNSGTKYVLRLGNLFYKKEGKYEKSPIINLIEKYGSTTVNDDKDSTYNSDFTIGENEEDNV